MHNEGDTKRVCVIGAESTGTTTLARLLAAHYETVWVPEYGRLYTEARALRSGQMVPENAWQSHEFLVIAQRQVELEDKRAQRANRVLFCDTDAMATAIWHERYMGTRSPEVEAIAAKRHYDLYLLTDCDIPFVQDGFRDGEKIREWMTQRFRGELSKRLEPWINLRGSIEERMAIAVKAVDELLKAKS